MDYKLQIISFICSFLFGIFFYLTSFINYKLIYKYSTFLKYFITLIYILDISLLYLLIMYKVNYGIVHIYFILILFLGFWLSSIYFKKIKKICKIKKKKL